MSRYKPQVGDEFDRLEIQELFIKKEGKQNKTYAKCLCKCGNVTQQRVTSLVQGRIVSCGCWKAERASERITKRNYKHGKSNLKDNRLYRIWSAMKSRCYNSNYSEYKNYGGRGINICDDWLVDYLNFENWALNNGYLKELSIDRIDVNGNYEPSNCRWVDNITQARNRRNNRQDTIKMTAFGETKAVRNWLEDERCKVKSMATLIYRIGAGWTPEDAVSKTSERS